MTYLAGVVGKPNVGKSTFFSAATLVSVPIANYPFTTIKPNHGIAYVRKPCVCKEFGVKDEPVNSICINGIRLIPVEMIDCAGLVPGAWQGRGLGNQFLDEIRRADALIHVIDAAGATDIEGKACPSGQHDPMEDAAFLDREFDMWIFQLLKKDWEKLAKRVETTKEDFSMLLEDRLSGLGVRRKQILQALDLVGLKTDKPTGWRDEQILALISRIRNVAKPGIIAANKMDLPESEANVKRLVDAGYRVVPCCAEAELALRRAAEKKLIEYTPGDPDFTIRLEASLTSEQRNALENTRKKILERYGSTGVQDCLNKAYFELLDMITVYPVEDAEKMMDHKGRRLPDAYLVPKGTTAKEFAYTIHSELGKGFIYAVEARSKKRIGDNYVLKDNDIISVVSTGKRA